MPGRSRPRGAALRPPSPDCVATCANCRIARANCREGCAKRRPPQPYANHPAQKAIRQAQRAIRQTPSAIHPPQRAFQHVPNATSPIQIVATPSPKAIRQTRLDGSLAQIVATLSACTTIRRKKRYFMARSRTNNLRERYDMPRKRCDSLRKTQRTARMPERQRRMPQRNLRRMDRLRGERSNPRRLRCGKDGRRCRDCSNRTGSDRPADRARATKVVAGGRFTGARSRQRRRRAAQATSRGLHPINASGRRGRRPTPGSSESESVPDLWFRWVASTLPPIGRPRRRRGLVNGVARTPLFLRRFFGAARSMPSAGLSPRRPVRRFVSQAVSKRRLAQRFNQP